MQSKSLSGSALRDPVNSSSIRTTRRNQSKQRLEVKAAGSTYGTNFRVTTFGESHGKAVGCVIDGVPPRLPITQEEIQVSFSSFNVTCQPSRCPSRFELDKASRLSIPMHLCR